MSKTKNKFHYTDEKDMETTPEKAVRITMLSFDQNDKICNRIDWIRDESHCMHCDASDELEISFEREDGIIAMKRLIQGLLKDFKNKSSDYHDRRDLCNTLLSAIKSLDDSLDRLYSSPCNCENCRRESNDDKK